MILTIMFWSIFCIQQKRWTRYPLDCLKWLLQPLVESPFHLTHPRRHLQDERKKDLRRVCLTYRPRVVAEIKRFTVWLTNVFTIISNYFNLSHYLVFHSVTTKYDVCDAHSVRYMIVIQGFTLGPYTPFFLFLNLLTFFNGLTLTFYKNEQLFCTEVAG